MLLSSRRARLVMVAAVAVCVVLLAVVGRTVARPRSVVQTEQRIAVDGRDGFGLDTTLFVPDGVTTAAPAPAVLLAHGFGGTKRSVADDALAAAERGYVVLTWSARGFGRSGGQISLNARDAEIADIGVLIDWLAERPEVLLDGPGDPRVGITGASYGGGASLLAAGTEARIDATVPVVAWHSLVSALSPNAAGDGVGVFKQQWASLLFTAGARPSPTAEASDSQRSSAAICGRFTQQICDAYADSAAAGELTSEAARLLQRADTAPVLGRITAPTLLVQATDDTLFPLSESLDNARGIAAGPAPLKVAWIPGGHAVGQTDGNSDRVRTLTTTWFDRWLRRDEVVDTDAAFEWFDQASGVTREASGVAAQAGAIRLLLSADGRLVADAPARGERSWTGPPGGEPAALTSLPGAGAFGNVLPAADIGGQHVAFESAPLDAPVQVLGAPSLRVRLTATDGAAIAFAKLYDVAPDGAATLPQRAVAPLRIDGSSAEVELQLAALAHRFAAGHRIRLVLASTDQAFANARGATVATVLTGPSAVLALPTVPPPGGGTVPLATAVAVLLAVVGVAVALWSIVRRRRGRPVAPQIAVDAAPVVVRGLSKTYRDGLVAVDGIDLQVGRGQVFGLLGPNGAGKTTTLRMLVGLIAPSGGTVELLGERIRPGHPVLRHVGVLVEGPGFAPYLSGMANLVSYWRAGGRPLDEAGLDRALTVAALGDAIHRRVATYSHGMRQRLAIAQALLGNPSLLILDEPTDGLDPRQIRGMRELLAGLATDDRTVLVSSHLLAEVEQVCTHVAVMDHGRVVAAGPVAELAGAASTLEIRTDDQTAARVVLGELLGATRVAVQGGALLVDLDGHQPPDLVAALVDAGLRVRTVTPRRRLEDAFLRLVDDDGGTAHPPGHRGRGHIADREVTR